MRRAVSESSKQTTFKETGTDDTFTSTFESNHSPSKDVESKRMERMGSQSLQRQRSHSSNPINRFEKMIFGMLIAFISVFVLCSLLYHLPNPVNTHLEANVMTVDELELLSNMKELNENSVTLVNLITKQEELNSNMKKLISLMEKERKYKVRNDK